MFRFKCPRCQNAIALDDYFKGDRTVCEKCNTKLKVKLPPKKVPPKVEEAQFHDNRPMETAGTDNRREVQKALAKGAKKNREEEAQRKKLMREHYLAALGLIDKPRDKEYLERPD